MTVVTVEKDAQGVRGICVSGHAEYAQSGRDIVCAAASVLTTTCVNALESVAGVKPRVTRDEQSATIKVVLPGDMSVQKRYDAELVMNTVLQGFSDIASEYPKHLQIKLMGRTSPC